MLPPKSEAHKPRNYKEYFDIHNRKLKELQKEGFVLDVSKLVVDPKKPGPYPHMKMKGSIALAGNMRMDVDKLLRLIYLPANNEYQVYTLRYSYSLIKGDHPVFRYCSPHDHEDYWDSETPLHHKFHHKHVFDSSGTQVDIKHLTDEEWPNLGQVLDEAKTYWDKK